MSVLTRTPVRWHRNVSAIPGFVKKPTDPRLAGYFYTGMTLHFGHYPPKKKG